MANFKVWAENSDNLADITTQESEQTDGVLRVEEGLIQGDSVKSDEINSILRQNSLMTAALAEVFGLNNEKIKYNMQLSDLVTFLNERIGRNIITGMIEPEKAVQPPIADKTIYIQEIEPKRYNGFIYRNQKWRKWLDTSLKTQIFTSNDTFYFTPITNTPIQIQAFGGGGGGGNHYDAGGGGGGYYSSVIYTPTDEYSTLKITVTIGDGGAGGQTGGTSSFIIKDAQTDTVICSVTANGGGPVTGTNSSIGGTGGSGGGGGSYQSGMLGGNGEIFGGGGSSTTLDKDLANYGCHGLLGGGGGAHRYSGESRNGLSANAEKYKENISALFTDIEEIYSTLNQSRPGATQNSSAANMIQINKDNINILDSGLSFKLPEPVNNWQLQGGGGGINGYGGKNSENAAGGGGGFYANGGNGAENGNGAGGGGGYGGKGKDGQGMVGGGGGGYGPANYGSGGNGGNTGESGTSGICTMSYFEQKIMLEALFNDENISNS